jgi:hypothetical protein
MSRRTTLVVVACVLTLLLTACERQKIGDITSDPGRFQDKEVSVAGQVTGFSIGALNMGLYQIDDGTGKLYVLSESRGAPTKGAYVGVKGKVMPTFTFLGKNYATVLRETGRKSVKQSD